jgi:hypothetical protein
LLKTEESELLKYYDNLFNNNYLVFDPDENYFDKIKQARFGTELWKLFLIIALILALAEMYISRSSKKDIISINQNK